MEAKKTIAFKGSSLALSASLCSAALPKGEPLAVPANFILLPKLFPFGAVDLQSIDSEGNSPKQKGLPHSFCAAAPLAQNDLECPPRALWALSAEKLLLKNYCYKSKPFLYARGSLPEGAGAAIAATEGVFQYRSTPSLVTRAYTSGASSGFSAPYTRPLRYSAAAASNLSAAP